MKDNNILDETNSDIKLPGTIEGCHNLIRELLKTVKELLKRVEKLEIENAVLKERLNTNSSNSSLPPSLDFKKKKKKKCPSSNKSGGKKGHKGHFRHLAKSTEVDAFVHCNLPAACACGGKIKSKEEYQRHQVYELPKIKLEITEYCLEKGRCCSCGREHVAELPEGITWGITGPRLTGFMFNLVGKYRLSRRELTEFLEEQFSFNISVGTVFNKQKIVTTALEPCVAELLTEVKQSLAVNVDETGHNRDGKKQWLWVIASPKAAFFTINRSRGKKVLQLLLGDFKDTVISDRHVAYNYFDSSQRQFCWSHLKRDFTRLSEKDNKIIRVIGKNLLAATDKLFDSWHTFKQKHKSGYELLRCCALCANKLANY